MKKVFGQTVRDIKREVNKKVLKVPSIERKVLDATCNEPWGPHGTLLADIAQASKNYHEFQMIMAVIWKRISDTGKNWRHVYKALLVLEYLVAYGSERVIDDIKEHSYQILTLSDFRYIDSGGRDQGSNVRKKSQSLVALVNDKEMIAEVRQKAASNREKFRNTSAGAGGYGDGYNEGCYGSRENHQNGYGYGSGREREYSYKDEYQYGRYGDSYGDRYGRDYDESQSRDRYRDDESRISDRVDRDSQSSSRGSGARADDQSLDGRPMERKFSEQSIAAPPSYEEAVSGSRSPAPGERNGETSATSAAGGSSPPASTASSPPAASAAEIQSFSQETTPPGIVPTLAAQENATVEEFDPRGPTAAAAPSVPAASPVPTTSKNVELDLLGSLLDLESTAPNPLATMSFSPATTTSEADVQPSLPGSALESSIVNLAFEDPFGDSPFKAILSAESLSAPPQTSAAPFESTMNQNTELPQAAASQVATPFGDAFSGMSYSAVSDFQVPSTNFLPQELSTLHEEIDILADILPPSGPSFTAAPQAGISAPSEQPGVGIYGHLDSKAGPIAPVASNMLPQGPQFSRGNFVPQGEPVAVVTSILSLQTPLGPPTGFNNGPAPQLHERSFMLQGTTAPLTSQLNNGNFLHQGTAAPITPQLGAAQQHNNGNFMQQGTAAPVTSQIGAAPQHNNGSFMQQGTVAPIMSQNGPSPQPNNGSFMQQETAAPFMSQTGSSPLLNNGSFMQQGTPAPVMSEIGQAPQLSNGSFMQQGTPAPVMSEIGPASQPNNGSFMQQGTAAPVMSQIGQASQLSKGNFLSHQGSGAVVASQPANQVPNVLAAQHSSDALGDLYSQGPNTSMASQPTNQAPNVLAAQHSGDGLGNLFSQEPNTSMASQPVLSSSTGALTMVPKPSKEKFETRSAVWADTLSRGLVNLDISGPKTNPLADIGVDFDAINRKEKRMEKPTTAAVTSTVTMGKAMGTGSGIGRAGAGAIRAPPNTMMGSGMGMGGSMNMGMGMSGAPGSGIGYGGMNQPMGMGVGMNMGMGQANYMQAPAGFSPGSTMPGGYNPMMGSGGYPPQQPYGGGYGYR